MKFDKARVYTALNADELEIGSICFLADTIAQLREYVESENDEYKHKIDHIFSERVAYRFCDKGASHFLYAYLIEPPTEVRFRNKEKISEKIDDLQIVHLSLRDIKEIARYAGLTIDTENLPDDDTDDDYTLFYSRSGIKFSDDGAYHIAMRSGYEDANEFMPIGREITP
ncbi:hypothetical protein H0R94_06785 [Treponema socranskii]|uniref:hypothetical protein n=1 Tax=Treponema socranskii TaxID=53419 RepID=UPI003D914272